MRSLDITITDFSGRCVRGWIADEEKFWSLPDHRKYECLGRFKAKLKKVFGENYEYNTDIFCISDWEFYAVTHIRHPYPFEPALCRGDGRCFWKGRTYEG